MSESLESRAAQGACAYAHGNIVVDTSPDAPRRHGGSEVAQQHPASIFGNSFDQEVRVTDEVRTVDYMTFLNLSLQITHALGNLPGLISVVREN